MKNTFSVLLATLMKQNYKGLISAFKENKKKQITYILLSLLIAVPLLVILVLVGYSVAGVTAEMGIFDAFLSMLMTASQLIVIFFGTFAFMSVMFFSKDNEFLLSLPVSESQIYWAKMIIVYLGEVALTTFVLLPVTIAAGIGAIAGGVTIGFEYWILMIVSIVFTPLIPLLLITVISFPLIYIISFAKKNGTLTSIFGIILFAGIMAGYMILVMNMSGGDVPTLPEESIKSFEVMGKIVYPNYVLAKAMVGSGNFFANFGIYIAILAGLFALSYAVSRFLYHRSLTSMGETSTSAKKKEYKVEKQKGVFKALLSREFKTTVKDASLSFYTFMGIVMAPLMVGILVVMMSRNLSFAEEIPPHMIKFITLGLALYMSLILGCSSYAPIIAISREREKLGMLKMLPVSSATIIKVKLLFSDIVSLIGSVLCGIVLITVSNVGVLNVIAYTVATALFGMIMNGWYIRRDIKKPILNWVSVKDITKKNFGMMIPMFTAIGVGLVLMLAPIFIGALYEDIGAWAYVIYWAIVYVVVAIGMLICRINLVERSVKIFDEIECS